MYYECVLFRVSRHISKLFQKSNKRRELNEKVNECATGSNGGSWGYKSDNKCRQIVDSVRIACSNLLVFVVYFLRKGSSPVSRSNIKKSDSKRNRSFLLRALPWLEVRGLGCRLGRSKTVSTGHQLRLTLSY